MTYERYLYLINTMLINNNIIGMNEMINFLQNKENKVENFLSWQ